jgi:hypothetical protein
MKVSQYDAAGGRNFTVSKRDRPVDFRDYRVLFILPCNAAACVRNYFSAEVYSMMNWNTWREAESHLRDLREKGIVRFAAVDSSTIEICHDDPLGAIVLETEMRRVINPTGEDWGAPSWRWYRPTRAGSWKNLEMLTDAVIMGVRRVSEYGIDNVVALVNPRAYFLALAAAVAEYNILGKWILFRVPAHPHHLIPAVKEVSPFVRAVTGGVSIKGGIYHVPPLFPFLQEEDKRYRHILPDRWKDHGRLPRLSDVIEQWRMIGQHLLGFGGNGHHD